VLPGVQPKPPSKFLQALMKSTAAATSRFCMRPRIEQASSAQYVNLQQKHSTPEQDTVHSCFM
jgi:hypothetical protein